MFRFLFHIFFSHIRNAARLSFNLFPFPSPCPLPSGEGIALSGSYDTERQRTQSSAGGFHVPPVELGGHAGEASSSDSFAYHAIRNGKSLFNVRDDALDYWARARYFASIVSFKFPPFGTKTFDAKLQRDIKEQTEAGTEQSCANVNGVACRGFRPYYAAMFAPEFIGRAHA